MADFLQVSTATESRDAGIALARSAVQARSAAGAQAIGPATSVYRQAHLVANHGWQNPEIIAIPVAAGSAPYLDWIQQTGTPAEGA
ncbi:MAG TPA: divalent cation tolerance protein CutA [Rugosimonospora sp.]|jgi:periplasmic divalent cation tolerance protein